MPEQWFAAYSRAADALPALAVAARPSLLGFSAFTDAIVALTAAEAIFSTDAPAPVRHLAAEIAERLRHGRGGEIGLDWPEGDAWFAARLPCRLAAGGTSLQIANVLALAGAACLLALGDRSEGQLAVTQRGVLVASDAGPLPVGDVAPRDSTAKARHWIFEARAGSRVADIDVRRSTRFIVRLSDDGPEQDPAFATLSAHLAPSCGAGAISSLVATPDGLIDSAFVMVGGLAHGWRRAGLPFLHLEFADYGPRRALATGLLATLRGAVTSLGMSLSEWRALTDTAPDDDALVAFARTHALSRLCIHADDWATAVTTGDPQRERRALMTGCLLASARAAAGQPVIPTACPDGARFAAVADDHACGEAWWRITVPSPYSATPASTIGLGDTFVAGCLLVHAGADPDPKRAS
jgi:ADP-dependent phosphofructokinase/glucokinase